MEPLAIGILLGLAALVWFYRSRFRDREGRRATIADESLSKRDVIRQALRELTTRTNEDAFVFLEDARSRKWVQFGGGADRPILFDLPAMALRPEEMRRAVELFEELGRGSLESFDVARREGGVPIEKGETYQIRFEASEIDAAADAALAVFARVYRLPETFRLAIDEN